MWTLRSDDRLAEWKLFRKNIGNLSFDDAVSKTVHLWSYAPFVAHYLDHCDTSVWPTPWELVANNTYDDMAKALGMIYTLFLSAHGSHHSFALINVKASSTLEHYSLVSIDNGKFILNYSFDEVARKETLSSDIEIIQTYSDLDLQLSKY